MARRSLWSNLLVDISLSTSRLTMQYEYCRKDTSMALAPLDSDPRLPAIRQMHSFHEGERVNFRSRTELALGLEDGYLELQLVDDQGLIHCIIRRVSKAAGHRYEGYLYTEAPVGKTHEWAVLHYLRT